MALLLPGHDEVGTSLEPGTRVGSVLYDVMPDHAAGLAVMVVLPLVGWAGWRLRAGMPVGRWRWLLHTTSPERQVAIAALVGSAAVHAAIVPAHGWSGESIGFAVAAALLWWSAYRLLHRRRGAVLLASVALLGSLLGLAVDAVSGTTPDQVAMLCKLIEIVGLLALWSPMAAGRGARVLGTVGAGAVAVVVAAAAWVSAFDAGGGGHHGGSGAVPVATLMESGHGDSGHGAVATADQRARAEALFSETAAAISTYRDPEVAAAAGYRTEGIRGTGFHAENPGYGSDGRVLDPQRPEYLIYAAGPGGPVLLGAMFETEGVDELGPAPGGPLTLWHSHEQVCFGLFPPSLAGATSPFGLCPAGSVTVARTGQMLHVWTVPGAPERFGDLPEEWLSQYLASTT